MVKPFLSQKGEEPVHQSEKCGGPSGTSHNGQNQTIKMASSGAPAREKHLVERLLSSA
jgi:hypothetical protein